MLLPTGVPTKRPDIITLKAALIFSADIKKKDAADNHQPERCLR